MVMVYNIIISAAGYQMARIVEGGRSVARWKG